MVSMKLASVNETLMKSYRKGVKVNPFTITSIEDVSIEDALTIAEEFMNAPRIDGFRQMMSHTVLDGELESITLEYVASKKQ